MPKEKKNKSKSKIQGTLYLQEAPKNGISNLLDELWEAAVTLRGSIEPADYKRYVLPIIFLRFLSLKYEKRRAELEKLVKEPGSDYYTKDPNNSAIPGTQYLFPLVELSIVSPESTFVRQLANFLEIGRRAKSAFHWRKQQKYKKTKIKESVQPANKPRCLVNVKGGIRPINKRPSSA